MSLRKKWREGDYIRALDPPRLGLVLSVRVENAGKVRLLIEDARNDCDGEATPTWQDADGWETVRPSRNGELPRAA